MYDIFNLVISLIIPVGLGVFINSCILRGPNLPFGPSLALGYGTGLGVIAYLMLIAGIFRLPLDVFVVPRPFSALLGILAIIYIFFCWKKNRKESNSHQEGHLSMFGRILEVCAALYIVYQIVFVFTQSLLYPIVTWDAVATVSLKSKVFFYDKSLLQLNLPHSAYPLLTPLIQAWQSFHLGYWSGNLVKIIIPLAFVSYLVLHYHFLRLFTSRLYCMLGLGLLLTANFFIFHATIGYRDIIMGYYNCAAIIVLLMWFRQKGSGLLILAALFSGFTSFVKLEGTIYTAIHILLLVMILWEAKGTIVGKVKSLFMFLTISVGMCSIFYIYKIVVGVAGMSGRLQMHVGENIFAKLLDIFQAFGWSLLSGGNWNVLWALMIISVLTQMQRLKFIKEIRYLWFTLLAFFGAYIIFLLFTQAPVHYPTTLSRVVLHFYPICPMLIVLLNAPLIEKSRAC